METVQGDIHSVDAGSTGGGGAGGGGVDDIHRLGAVVVHTGVHDGDIAEVLHSPAEVVLLAVVIPRTAGSRPDFQQHGGVHQQQRSAAVHHVGQLIQLVNKSIGVAVQLGGIGQVNVRSELIGGTRQSLSQAVEGVRDIPGAGRGGGAIDHQIVEIVACCLDLLLRLECQLINGSGGALNHTVNLEGTAHDNGLGGLFLPLRLACGVFAVDSTDSRSRGGFQLNVTVGQSRTAGTGGNGVIKHQSVQQQRTAPELVDHLLIDLVGHADLCFCKSNCHS